MAAKRRLSEYASTSLSLILLSVATYVAVSPGGVLHEKITDWRDIRTQRASLATEWEELAAGANRISRQGGEVDLVVFTDYMCPFCAQLEDTLTSMRVDDALNVGYRHLPLPIHPGAQDAAIAAICAGEQEHFAPMHFRLITSDGWHRDADWRLEAEQIGIPDMSAFLDCVTSERPRVRLNEDMRIGRALNLRSTPTLVTHSFVVSGVQTSDAIKSLTGRK